MLVPLSSTFQLNAAVAQRVRSQLLPTPRENVQLSLEAPELVLGAYLDASANAGETVDAQEREALAEAIKEGRLPDVAQAYALWREQGTGRIINAADWFSVFKAQQQQPALANGAGAGGPTNGVSDASNEEAQAGFAAALYQMANAGLIKSTTKKAEHIGKSIFDLPVVPDIVEE